MKNDTLYDRLKSAGCEMTNHESDLYVELTDSATEIFKAYARETGTLVYAQPFINQITKTLWVDIPFAYIPFWERVNQRSQEALP